MPVFNIVRAYYENVLRGKTHTFYEGPEVRRVVMQDMGRNGMRKPSHGKPMSRSILAGVTESSGKSSDSKSAFSRRIGV